MENSLRTNYSNLNSVQTSRQISPSTHLSNEYSFLNNPHEQNQFERYSLQLNHVIGNYKSKFPPIQRYSSNRNSINNTNQKIKQLQNMVNKKIKQNQNSLSLHQTERKDYRYSQQYQHFNHPRQIQYLPIYNNYPIMKQQYQQCKQFKQKQVQKNDQFKIQSKMQPQINFQTQNSKQKEKSALKKPKQEKKRVKKLKIYVYVVFFSLYFPKYSKKFNQYRRQFLQNQQKMNKLPQISLFKLLQTIDIYKIKEKSLSEKQAYMILDWNQLTNTALIPKSQSKQSQQKMKDLFSKQICQGAKGLLRKICKKLRQQKRNANINQLFLKLSISITNNCFLISNSYYQEQSHIIIVHKHKNQLKLSLDHQIQLILIHVFYKLIIQKFLQNLTKNKNYLAFLVQKHNIHKSQLSSIERFVRNIKLFLFVIYQQLFEDFMTKYGKKSNFIEKAGKMQITLINQIKQDLYFYKTNNEISFPTIFRKIQVEQFQHFSRNNQFLVRGKQQLKQKIIDLCKFLHDEICDRKFKHYQDIKNIVLGTKNLLTKQSEITKQIVRQQKISSKVKNLKYKLFQNLNKVNQIKQNGINQKEKENQQCSQLKKIQKKKGKLAENRINQLILDVVNVRSQDRRQDQIRQRFRNILNKK